ncbi:putative GTPase [Dyadobacter sp. CECT 9275]|uniref:GTPase n=1 Tax=Dyadobacter helix TaxID=2822344 RepID=A0A916JFK1_9BACT|nr:methylmalonyl Co-A mutase-associated GTPase MeaB [Dyadobacter sp. CECT 9275]CAG5009532.1 putative GTPase [Dyadobacter sp. CECT 9275]
MHHRLSVDEFIRGITAADRVILGRAVTLIESSLETDRHLADQLMVGILPFTGKSLRLGITGIPGVGKSTFIEALGKVITQSGHKLAVLAIDPSSARSGGSIMGDKTRMEKLSQDPNAFIRPSPAGNSLGGVARTTRETILLCEAAGYEIILVETVGVGQSETLVKGMTDVFVLLMLAGAGDEIQGIKRGIMEMVDLLVLNKADGDNKAKTLAAVADLSNALHLFPRATSGLEPKVMPCSALTGEGIQELWGLLQEYQNITTTGGFFGDNRKRQNTDWMHDYIRNALEEMFYHNPAVKQKLAMIEKEVLDGKAVPFHAAQTLLDLYAQNKNR